MTFTRLVGGDIPEWRTRREALRELNIAYKNVGYANGHLHPLRGRLYVDDFDVARTEPVTRARQLLDEADVRLGVALDSQLAPKVHESADLGLELVDWTSEQLDGVQMHRYHENQVYFSGVDDTLEAGSMARNRIGIAVEEMARSVAQVAPTKELTGTGKLAIAAGVAGVAALIGAGAWYALGRD